MRTRQEVVHRWLELALVALAAAWTLRFFWLQTPGLLDPHFLEWDARAHTLQAWRYHGTGLFPHDLLVDFAAVYYPPGVKLVYWLGTFFVNPHWISKWVPFALAGIVVWQSHALGRHFGGRALGAAAVVLILHCHFVWGRLLGVNARAFGFPLIIAFLRYAAEGRERPALTVLLLETFFYPSTFLICAPAYAATLLRPWKLDRRWRNYFAVVGAGLVVLALTALRVDPRIGHPILMKELEPLVQRAIVGTWPLPPARWVMTQTFNMSVEQIYGMVRLLPMTVAAKETALEVIVAVLVLLAAWKWRATLSRLPLVFPGAFLGSLVAFAVAQSFPYRLYLPERLLQYSWPPVLLFSLLLLAYFAFASLTARWAGILAAVLVCGLELTFYGDGFQRDINMWDWSQRDDATVQYVKTLPKDVMIACHFNMGSNIQTFARRQVLFSSILNTPIHYPIALELERRIKEYYLAYYARDLAPVKAMMQADHVDYLIVDERDFGADALNRATYAMWTPLARSLITAGPVDQMIFAHPPDEAIAFRNGPVVVIDLHKL